jgi:hypothetical protein
MLSNGHTVMMRLKLLLALLVLVALALPGAAWADDPGFIDQYEEPFPTGGGNDHSGSGGSGGSGGGNATQVPGPTLSELQASVDPPVAKALKSVTTSPELGAPQQTFADRPDGGASAADPDAAATSLPKAFGTSAEAENPYLLAILLGLLVTTLAGAAVVLLRRRSSVGPD